MGYGMRTKTDLQLAYSTLLFLIRRPNGIWRIEVMKALLHWWTHAPLGSFEPLLFYALTANIDKWSFRHQQLLLTWATKLDPTSDEAEELRRRLDQYETANFPSNDIRELFQRTPLSLKLRSRSAVSLANIWAVASVNVKDVDELRDIRHAISKSIDHELATNDIAYTSEVLLDLAESVNRDAVTQGDRDLGEGSRYTTAPAAYEETSDGKTIVKVWFGTDRERAEQSPNEQIIFTGECCAQARVTFGTAHVSIPSAHSEGVIERPSIWKLEFRENADKHMLIRGVEVCSVDEWRSSMANSSENAVLFIHGFNVDFDEALLRTAQLAYDLKFPGIPLCFSWPAKKGLSNYMANAENVEWAVPHLREFLFTVAAVSSVKKIHVIAHSMGSRLLMNVLRDLSSVANESKINQIVFAAPDIFKESFKQMAGCLDHFDQATLYASSADWALKASKQINNHPRAGDADPPLVISHVHTVDVTAVGEQIFGLGHSYYGEASKVIGDLFYIVWRGFKPYERASGRYIEEAGYYVLK